MVWLMGRIFSQVKASRKRSYYLKLIQRKLFRGNPELKVSYLGGQVVAAPTLLDISVLENFNLDVRASCQS